MFEKIIVIAIIVLILGGAIAYIVKAKKSGRKCIGCPASCSCSSKNKKQADGGEEAQCCCCHKDE